MQGALVMGAAFGLGAIPPILPHLFAPRDVAVILSVGATLAVLFGIGVVKSRWTHRSWWSSGFEILVLGAIAGIAGYFFGSVLPILLGAPEAAG
jgi:vacuolar iron transporter family protein